MPTKKEKHGAGKKEQEPAPTVLLPAPIDSASAVSTVASLADIPEEEIWLAKQKNTHPARLQAGRAAFYAHADNPFL
jgi:hypothetical protein